jgi:hypothetical protein
MATANAGRGFRAMTRFRPGTPFGPTGPTVQGNGLHRLTDLRFRIQRDVKPALRSFSGRRRWQGFFLVSPALAGIVQGAPGPVQLGQGECRGCCRHTDTIGGPCPTRLTSNQGRGVARLIILWWLHPFRRQCQPMGVAIQLGNGGVRTSLKLLPIPITGSKNDPVVRWRTSFQPFRIGIVTLLSKIADRFCP